jgi:hypothetical protein
MHPMPNLFGIHRQQLLMQTGAVLPQAEPRSGVETLHVLMRAPGTLALNLRGRSDSGGNRTRDTLLFVRSE